MDSMTPAEADLFSLYRNIFQDNPACSACRAENPSLSLPVGAWFVGIQFEHQSRRVLFVGKNARGQPGQTTENFLCEFSYAREELWTKSWPYWSYTRAISLRLFGNDSPENIAFTNLIKCNDSDTLDTTTPHTMECCIRRLQIFRKEVAIIRPTHIVFYTGRGYDRFLLESPGIFDRLTITRDTVLPVGKKSGPWLEADALLDGHFFRVLRTGHPERLKKDAFTAAIAHWVNKGNEK